MDSDGDLGRLPWLALLPAAGMLCGARASGCCGQTPAVQNMGLAVVVDMLLLATIEDLVPEADAPHTRRIYITSAFAGGFVFFMLLSLYLG